MPDMTLSSHSEVGDLGGSERAAHYAALSYRVHGVKTVDVFPLLEDDEGGPRQESRTWAVRLPSLKRIECVLDDHSDIEAVAERLATFSTSGWSVWAVVPLAHLGDAHDCFRSVAEFVQGWWLEPKSVAFTAPEIP